MTEIRKRLEPPIEPTEAPAPRTPRLEASNDTGGTYAQLERAVEDYLQADENKVEDLVESGCYCYRLNMECYFIYC